jgi:hypothetical protein
MGNESYIIDIRGFSVYYKTEDRYNSDISLSLNCAMGERDRNRINEIEDKDIRKAVYKVFDKMSEIDPDIESCMSNQCEGQSPMAIGWSDMEKATPEKLVALKEILEEAGFIVEVIEKDRFITYG